MKKRVCSKNKDKTTEKVRTRQLSRNVYANPNIKSGKTPINLMTMEMADRLDERFGIKHSRASNLAGTASKSIKEMSGSFRLAKRMESFKACSGSVPGSYRCTDYEIAS